MQRTIVQFAATLLLSAFCCGHAIAQEQAPGPEMQPASGSPLPTVEEVMKNFVNAMGGPKAVADLETAHTYLLLESGSQVLDIETHWHRDGAFQMRYTRGETEFAIGSDANVTWQFDTRTGYIVLPQAAVGRAAEQAGLSTMLFQFEQRYKDMKVVGEGTFNDRPIYLLELTDHEDKVRNAMFDRETSLLIAVQWEEQTPKGPIRNTMTFSDWKEFGPLRTWTRVLIQRLGASSTMTITKIEFNSVDPQKFVLPAQVKELVDKMKTTGNQPGSPTVVPSRPAGAQPSSPQLKPTTPPTNPPTKPDSAP